MTTITIKSQTEPVEVTKLASCYKNGTKACYQFVNRPGHWELAPTTIHDIDREVTRTGFTNLQSISLREQDFDVLMASVSTSPSPAVRGYNSVMKFLEQVMGDNDTSTISERLKAAELYLQYKGIPERDLKAGNAAPATTNNYTPPPPPKACFEVLYEYAPDGHGDSVRRVVGLQPLVASSILPAEPQTDERYWVQVMRDKVLGSFGKDEIFFVTPI